MAAPVGPQTQDQTDIGYCRQHLGHSIPELNATVFGKKKLRIQGQNYAVCETICALYVKNGPVLNKVQIYKL